MFSGASRGSKRIRRDMKRLCSIVENRFFQGFILAVIVFNSVVFGLQTSQPIMAKYGRLLGVLDQVCLAIFVIELVLKLIVYNWRFPRDAWNIIDFLVVSVSFVPDMGMLSSARLLRVLRVFKLISGVKQMRVILSAIMKAVPGIAWSGILLLLFYYVYGIIGTVLFGKAFPDWFGSLGASVYSLFQIMTLESWSMGIARPVIAVFPLAWIYFVSYILIASFVVMNIVVGIVLNSINESSSEDGESANDDMASIEAEFEKLKIQVQAVERLMKSKKGENK